MQEPDVGHDPGTPGSRPESKADAQPLNHPGIPGSNKLSNITEFNILYFSDRDYDRYF